MTGPRVHLRRAAAVAALVLVSTGLLVPAASARSAPYAHGSTTGEVDCGSQTGCQQWAAEGPPGAATWSLDEKKTHTRTGASATASAKLEVTEVDTAQGMLGSLTLTATLKAEVTGSSRALSKANASADFVTRATTLQIDGLAATEAEGTDSLGSSADVHVSLDCGSMDVNSVASAGFDIPTAHDEQPLARDVPVLSEGGNGAGECSLNISFDAGGGTDRGVDGAQRAAATATIRLTILAEAPAPTQAGCDLAGAVTDGDVTRDQHNNPLHDIRVELRRDDAIVGDPVATDASGRYCFPEGMAEPGSYKLRATLIDQAHDPPMFSTREGLIPTDPAWAEIPIAAADFGSLNVDLTFTGTADRPRLPDLANIHWQSQRLLDWILGKLAISPAALGPFSVVAFDENEIGTRYTLSSATVFLTPGDSVFATRTGPLDDCPENCEWHEIAHHVGSRLGIANTTTSAACAGRTPHAGWSNATTCDSLAEGFAMFLPVLASYDIDATAGAGYGTTDYGPQMFDAEANDFTPWSTETFAGGKVVYREDVAVAQLLWDLADPSDGEHENLPLTDAADPANIVMEVDDRVALGGVELVHILVAAMPETVADVRDALLASADVPVDLKGRSPEFDPAHFVEPISQIDEIFLLHQFHPVRDARQPRFELGDPISLTSHVPDPPGFIERRHVEPLAGSNIRLSNPGPTAVVFAIDVAHTTAVSHFEATVAAGSARVIHLEVPPYWTGLVGPGEGLPACGGSDQHPITVTVSAPGVATRTIDSCEFLHAVVASPDGVAITVGGAIPPSGAGGAASIAGIVALAVLAVVLAIGLVALGRRRRRRPA